MGYVESVLLPGETVRFRTGRHWVLYLPGIAVAVPGAGCAAWTAWTWATADFGETVDTVWIALSAGLLVLAAGLLLRAWYRRRVTEIAVTDRRVIYKSGLLRRSTSEMPLERIEKVDVDQGLLGQMLDFGNVSMNGIACGIGADRLRRIAAPIRLRSHVVAGDGVARRPLGPLVAEIGSPPLAAAPALAEGAPAAAAR
ncbi:PH domain-containing protein [Rhodoplanes sp. TEM]|uniref:PH domain-containing protein n=1 Tax=Rhodoplanes tepidamans TaxID=200616 RepID=A0ABT5JGW1_RHOTP|nr:MULTISPECIES: PH domain-containing protein [Rhodoplanes]MDC7788819.1 PH domain-containing protein [Rhodoplanes tepidamans]MDC7987683.1 PH domain-containing protein [Rhodoplanes sp. TEM]MDQ0359034.1 membrane protein YdbS with pleckstrin-like domain [Rhodoplanes tepidamans]